MSTCEHSDTFVSPTGAYEHADCDADATHRIVVRDLSFVGTPFELQELELCEPHKELVTTDVDEHVHFELVLVDGMTDN